MCILRVAPEQPRGGEHDFILLFAVGFIAQSRTAQV